MADDESILTHPRTPDDAWHVRDYSRFTAMLKYSAVASFLIAMLVLVIIS